MRFTMVFDNAMNGRPWSSKGRIIEGVEEELSLVGANARFQHKFNAAVLTLI